MTIALRVCCFWLNFRCEIGFIRCFDKFRFNYSNYCFFCIKDLAASSDSGEYKMVLAVRQDLGMGKGKIAAQVGKSQQGKTAVEFFLNCEILLSLIYGQSVYCY